MGFSVESFFICYLEKGYIIDRIGGGYKNNKKDTILNFEQDNKTQRKRQEKEGGMGE